MADPVQQVVEEPVEGLETPDLASAGDESTQNLGTDPSPEPKEDWEGKLKAIQAEKERIEERYRLLEQTARLQERALEEARQPRERAASPSSSASALPKELEDLDKLLEPLKERWFGSLKNPIYESQARLYEQLDAQGFENYLFRNHPDVFEEDGQLDKIYQEVEQVRERAKQQYGQWLSRQDAFLYAQGISGVREKIKSRSQKKATQVRDEAKRLQQVQATRTSTPTAPGRRDGAAEINAIRAKLERGERLTDAEREKFRTAASGVTI